MWGLDSNPKPWYDKASILPLFDSRWPYAETREY